MRLTLTLSTALFLAGQLAAQWTPLASGMFSNRSLCAHQGDLYCATYPNGVKKSVNGTGPFTAVNTGLPASGNNCFAQSVGTDGAYLYTGTESGVFRSGDGGASWNNINGTLTASPTVFANKFFAMGSNILAVFSGSIAQGGGIWRSGNFGNTWLIGNSGMGSNVTVHHLTQVGGTIWASTSTGFYTSTDNAESWTPHPSVNYTVYSMAAQNGTLVMACTYGMRYSTNGGTSWLDATGEPGAPTDGEVVAFDGLFFTVLPSPAGCLRSTDNGVTWSDYNTGFSEVDAASQEEFLVVGNTLYCTALFDIYSIEATGNGIVDRTASASSAFPTVFSEGFTLRTTIMDGDLLLIDQAGRIVRSVRITTSGDRWMDRADLPVGAYTAIINDRRYGTRIGLGTLIAR